MDGQPTTATTLTAAARIGSLAHYSAKNSRTFVRVLAIDLTDEAKGRAGTINGVLKAEMTSAVGESLAAHVEDALMRGVVEAIRRGPTNADQEAIFEASVGKVNEVLRRLLGYDGPFHCGEGLVSGLLFSQSGTDIVAAIWGRPSLLLFHPSAGRVKIFDLLDDEAADGSIGFSRLIAGSLGRNDVILASTEDLRNAVGAEKLSEIIAGREPAEAAAAVRESLMMGKSTISAAMFILRPDDGQVPRGAADSTQKSMDHLLATAHRTRDIMSSSPISALARSAGTLFTDLVGRVKAGAKSDGETERQSDKVAVSEDGDIMAEPVSKTESSVSVQVAAPTTPSPQETRIDIPRSVMAAALMGSRPTVFRPETVLETERERGKEGKRESDEAVKQIIDETVVAPRTPRLSSVLASFNSLTVTSRGLLLSAATLAIVFNYSLAATGIERRLAVAADSYDETVSMITQKMDSAEASLIYGDETRAMTLIAEAEALINGLPRKTAREKTTADDLLSKVNVKRLSLRKAVALAAPESVTTLGSGLVAPDLTRLAFAGNALWSGSANGDIHRTDIAAARTDFVGSSGKAGASVFAADDNGLFAGSPASLKLFGNSGQSHDRTMPAGGEPPEVTDSAFWGTRLYLLDAKHNRILKMQSAGKGFGEPQFFVKDGTDLTKARSIAIDGNVWVLSFNGRIDKMVRGAREEFAVEPADPPVKHALRLRTEEGLGNLYVLDSMPSRLLVFDKKNGRLTAQYLSESIDGATDFVVGDGGKSATFAVGNKLVKFELPEAK
jgi:hypothetical protein